MSVESSNLYKLHIKRFNLINTMFFITGILYTTPDLKYLGPILRVSVYKRSVFSLFIAFIVCAACCFQQTFFIFSLEDLTSRLIYVSVPALSTIASICFLIKNSESINGLEHQLFSINERYPYQFKSLTMFKILILFYIVGLFLASSASFIIDEIGGYYRDDLLEHTYLVNLQDFIATVIAQYVVIVMLRCALALYVLEESMWNLNMHLDTLTNADRIEQKLKNIRIAHHEICVLARKTYEKFGIPIMVSVIGNSLLTALWMVVGTRIVIRSYSSQHVPDYTSITKATFALLLHFSILWILTNNSNKFADEVRSTGIKIQKVCFSAVSHEIRDQSILFSTQLLLSDFKPLVAGYFHLNNSFYFMMLGALASFTIITLQLGKEYSHIVVLYDGKGNML